MDIRLLGDRVLVIPHEAPEETKSGIILSDFSKKRPSSGTVYAIGPKVTELKVGDNVIYGEYPWERKLIDGKEMFLFTSEDIIAKEVPHDSSTSLQ